MDAHSAPIGSPKKKPANRRSAASKPISRPSKSAGAHAQTRRQVPTSIPQVEQESDPSTERTRPIRVQVDTGIARTESFRRVAMNQASQLRLGMRWYQALTNVIHPLLFLLGLIIAWRVGTGRIWETGDLTAAVMYRVNPNLALVDIGFAPFLIFSALLHLLAFLSLRLMRRRAPLISTIACIALPLVWLLHDIWQSTTLGGRVGIWVPLLFLVACTVLAVFDWGYLQKRKTLFVH